MRNQRKLNQKSSDPESRKRLLDKYRTGKEEYKRRLEEIKLESWEIYVSQHIAIDPWGKPYMIMAEKINNPVNISILRDKDGSLTKDWRSSAELLLTRLLPDDSIAGETPDQTETRRQTEIYLNNRIVVQLEVKEVRKVIEELKPRKATGPDGFPNEFLMALQRTFALPVRPSKRFPRSGNVSRLTKGG